MAIILSPKKLGGVIKILIGLAVILLAGWLLRLAITPHLLDKIRFETSLFDLVIIVVVVNICAYASIIALLAGWRWIRKDFN